MDQQLYREILLEHYRKPHNFGILDEYNCTSTGINPLCGDEIMIYVQVDGVAKDSYIKNISFQGTGCTLSIAGASLLTDEVKNRSLIDIEAMSEEHLINLLGIQVGLVRRKCVILSLKTLKKALTTISNE